MVRSRGKLKAQTPPAEAVPITAVAAKVEDVPVGVARTRTVQAFNTVEIKAQVTGILAADLRCRKARKYTQGDIVAQIDPRPYQAALDQVTAQRAEDAANCERAARSATLSAPGEETSSRPVQQVDDQQATVNKLVAMLQADTAAIETAQINLDYCTIRAPINGRVSFHQTDVGNLIQVASQTGIVSITQDKPISVVFTLAEAELPSHSAGYGEGNCPSQSTRATTGASSPMGNCSRRTMRSIRHRHRSSSRRRSPTTTTRCGRASSSMHACASTRSIMR